MDASHWHGVRWTLNDSVLVELSDRARTKLRNAGWHAVLVDDERTEVVVYPFGIATTWVEDASSDHDLVASRLPMERWEVPDTYGPTWCVVAAAVERKRLFIRTDSQSRLLAWLWLLLRLELGKISGETS